MRRPPTTLVALCVCLVCAGNTRAADWPVTTLSYDGSVGTTETEEGELEESSYRHQVTLRVRERWSRNLSATLEGVLVRKDYAEGSSGTPYVTLGVVPTIRATIVPGLRVVAGLQTRRYAYDNDGADPDVRLKSYTRVRADTDLTIDVRKGFSVSPAAQATFDLYDDPTKTRQTYTLSMGLDAKLGPFALGADYRALLRRALGGLSLVESRLDHVFGVDFTWDPNP
jgi:hypothetical protein